MVIPEGFALYYQRLRDLNYAVFGVVATVVYTLLYICLVPFVFLFVPRKKKLSHTAWRKWSYKADTLDDVRKQY